MSGVGGEVGELDELLRQMQEARNDAVALKNTEKNTKLESEKKRRFSGRNSFQER